jgi:hypothetical protein
MTVPDDDHGEVFVWLVEGARHRAWETELIGAASEVQATADRLTASWHWPCRMAMAGNLRTAEMDVSEARCARRRNLRSLPASRPAPSRIRPGFGFQSRQARRAR